MTMDPIRERLISLVIDVGMLRRDVATDIADAILSKMFQRAGWAEPDESISEVHESVVEFATDYHSAAGDSVVELMPVFVGPSVWGCVTGYGQRPDEVEEYEVSLHATREMAEAQHIKDNAQIEVEMKRSAEEANA